jgi:pseudouridine 5'-phosphatase
MKTMDPRCNVEKREIFELFDGRVACGDDSKLGMGPWASAEGGAVKFVRAKPAPDIFLSAAELIGRPVGREETPSMEEVVERSKGLVFEDGIPGVQAALKAGMQGKSPTFSYLVRVPLY